MERCYVSEEDVEAHRCKVFLIVINKYLNILVGRTRIEEVDDSIDRGL